MQWIVSQVGARQHYATPRSFHLRNELKTFYTDAWSGRARNLLKHAPGTLKALADRFTPHLPPDKVVAANWLTLWDRATQSWRVSGPSSADGWLEWMREGQRFGRWVNRRLDRNPPNPATDAFFGVKSISLETLEHLKKRGVFTLLDQADPARVEEDLVRAEREKWPGWEPATEDIPQAYHDRAAAEWAIADLIMVNSDWTRQAIIDQGVPGEKVIVVPLGYEHPTTAGAATPRTPGARMTVLWLGTVILRKGIPYLLEAAKKLIDRPIDFVIAGGVQISPEAVASAPPNVKFIGRVLRAQADAVYRSADLFVLPTISDSFALTQIEAMAHGLPVIATPRCGAVVTENVDGMIVPPGDADALAAAIARLDDDRTLLASMSAAAIKKSATFTLEKFATRLHDEVARRRPELASAT